MLQQLWPKQGTSVTFLGAKSELIARGVPAAFFVDEYAMPWDRDFMWRIVVDTPSGWTLPDRARRLVTATPYVPYNGDGDDEEDDDEEEDEEEDEEDDEEDDEEEDDWDDDDGDE